jgi:hypothetical protein
VEWLKVKALSSSSHSEKKKKKRKEGRKIIIIIKFYIERIHQGLKFVDNSKDQQVHSK